MIRKARQYAAKLPSSKVVKLGTNTFPPDKEFNFMFREGWDAFSKLRLSPTETAVFSRLMYHMGFANWVPVSQETLGEELGIRAPHVSAALKRLLELKVVERQRDPNDKRRWQYRINNYLGWKGSPSSWRQESDAGKVVPLYPIKN